MGRIKIQITGEPGAGKSVALSYILGMFQDNAVSFTVVKVEEDDHTVEIEVK